MVVCRDFFVDNSPRTFQSSFNVAGQQDYRWSYLSFAIVGIITAITGIASASTSSVYMNRHRASPVLQVPQIRHFFVENKGKDIKYDIVAAPQGNLTWKFRAADLSGSEWGMVLKGKRHLSYRSKS